MTKRSHENLCPPLEADTLPKILKWGCEKWGDRVFMRRKNFGIWQRWTWQNVFENVKSFCLGLMSVGLQPGETVAMIGENEPELFWAHWAAQAARAKTVCLYPDVTSAEAHYILDHSEAAFLIAEDQEQVDKILKIKDRLPRLKKLIFWDPRGLWKYLDPILMHFNEVQEEGRRYEKSYPGTFEKSVSEGKIDDIAVLSYTSGTTGARPKGVIMTHRALIDNFYRVSNAVALKPFTQYLSYISPAWATEQWFGLSIGLMMPFVLNFPEEPETVLENIREIGAKMLCFSPRQWESLASSVKARMLDANFLQRFCYDNAMKIGRKVAEAKLTGHRANPMQLLAYSVAWLLVLRPVLDRLGLLKTKLALSGGSAMAPEVFYLFHSMGLKLKNIYGMTEFGCVSLHTGDQFDPGTVGRFLKGHPLLTAPMEWKVSSETGELLLRGGYGFSGYYNDPEESTKMIKEGWFCSGDSVSVKQNGELVYLERVSDMRYLSTGVAFPPQFFETRLRFSPFIKEAMCLGDEEKPFVSALINIDAETTGRWAEGRGVAFSTFPDLSQSKEVRELVKKEIEEVNKVLPPESQIRRFANIPKEFDPDESELTRTRKLRRKFLEDRYKELVQAIYEGKNEISLEVPVKYRDGRLGKVAASTKIVDVESPMVT